MPLLATLTATQKSHFLAEFHLDFQQNELEKITPLFPSAQSLVSTSPFGFTVGTFAATFGTLTAACAAGKTFGAFLGDPTVGAGWRMDVMG